MTKIEKLVGIVVILTFMVLLAIRTSTPVLSSDFGSVTVRDGIDSSITMDVVSYEEQKSARVTFGHKPTFMVHLNGRDISAATAFMLIDLSDSVGFPHTKTGTVIVEWITMNVNPSSTFRGDVEIGFLENVDGSNGDFHEIHDSHLEKQAAEIAVVFSHTDHGLALQTSTWLGPTNVDDTTFQTDVRLIGPTGVTAHNSGDGDMVIKISQTAGDMAFGIAVGYTTID